MYQIRALLFDMDGVLINSHQAVTAFWEKLAAEYEITLTPADYDNHVYGCPPELTFDRLFSSLTLEQRGKALAEMYHYEETQPYVAVPGVLPFLKALKDHGVPTALVTSGDDNKVGAVFAQLQADGLFTTMVTLNDVPHGKPNPAPYLMGAERLGVEPSECLFFEDSISGMQAGIAAGATGVGVWPEGDRLALREAGATTIIPNFTGVRLHSEAGELIVTINSSTQFTILPK